MGYGGDYLTATIKLKSKSFLNVIFISQNAVRISNEVSISFLIFEYEYINSAQFNLSINLRDFFDKIFTGKRILTSNNSFDKKFTINSSNKFLAIKLFRDDKIQNFFINNSFLVFNILTTNGVTKISMKYMERDKLYTDAELTEALENFKYILSKLFN